ncbi:MAG: hypothetical protein AAF519_07945 [Bacteroidota bacterium]
MDIEKQKGIGVEDSIRHNESYFGEAQDTLLLSDRVRRVGKLSNRKIVI